MEKIVFIGYRRSDLTTKRGEVLYGYNLFFKLPLDNGGTGFYGTYKFVSDDRIKSLGGLPPLDVPCVVSFDRFGMFTSIEDVSALEGN